LTCWALEKEFAGLGHTTKVAENGAEALAELRRQSYGIVFLDIHLPDGNGIELLREIDAISRNSKIIIMSGDATETNRERAFAGGALQFLEKPLDLSEIHSILKSTLGAHSNKRKTPAATSAHPASHLDLGTRAGGSTVRPSQSDRHGGDFGLGGLRLQTDYPLKVGQNVRARADAEYDHFRRIAPPNSPARVVWVAPAQDGVMAGLQFVN